MLIRAAHGFSLIELLIAIAITGVLLALGLPEFNTYLANTRLRTAAGVFVSSMQTAKAAAAARNQPVQLILTATPNPANLADAVAATSAIGWMVRTVDLLTYIDGKSLIEGGRGTQAQVVLTGSVSGVTFTALGGTTLGAAATFAFTNPEGGACVTDSPAGPMRCLNVIVSTTGRVKLCDPAVAVPDTRACT